MSYMTDRLSPPQRHANMAAIHGKDTKPEIMVRRWLWGHGFRYRLNHPRLPGRPDVVLRKYRTCIFVNGCFWHGHMVDSQPRKGVGGTAGPAETGSGGIESSSCCKIPKTNRDFWVGKIMRNRERDARVQQELSSMGWHSITVWECQLKPAVREETLESLALTLYRIFLRDHRAKGNCKRRRKLST